tara:strand:+ start:123 stop:602 length:480 start_codon:yes stop_codon:yes gene_type:complete
MPYSVEDLKKKESYQKIYEADKNELKKFFEDEELKAEISGSVLNAINTLRDERGFILSYEDPDNPGQTYPSNVLQVRVPIRMYQIDKFEAEQKLEKDKKFSNFRPNLSPSESEDIEALRRELRSSIDEANTRERLAADKETELQNTIQTLEQTIENMED